jgi:hypothetical protein
MRLPLVILLLGLLLPSAALAKGDGKVEFDKAMRFYQAQEYDAALPYFQKAYERSGKRPSTIRALAQCERALKQYEQAIAHFKEYLASKPSDAKEVEETLELLTELLAEKQKAEPQAEPKTEPKGEVKPPPKAESKIEVKKTTPPPPPPPKIDPPPPPPPAITHSAPPPAEESSIVESPILWIAVGAAVLVGGGVAIALAVSGGEDGPYPGTSGVVLVGP